MKDYFLFVQKMNILRFRSYYFSGNYIKNYTKRKFKNQEKSRFHNRFDWLCYDIESLKKDVIRLRLEYIYSGGFDGQYSEMVIDDSDIMLTFSKENESMDADGRIDEEDLINLKTLVADIDWSTIKTQYGQINYNQYYHTVMIDLNEAQRYGVTVEGSAYGEISKDLDKLIYHLVLLQGKYLHELAGRCNPRKMPFPFALICDKNDEVTKRVLQDFILEYRKSPDDVKNLEEELQGRWKNA